MKRNDLRWHRSFAACILAAALAIGAGLAWAEVTATSAPAVSPENHAAAIEAFKSARDLFTQQKYAEANAANEKALKLDPTLPDALMLRKILQTKLTSSPETTSAPAPAPGAKAPALLNASDISLIRFHELSPEDMKQIKGKVDRKTLDSFWNGVVKKEDSSASKEAYTTYLGSFTDQVERIKNSGNIGYMEKVEFTGDPAALLVYKKIIQPYVLQNCATALCHAGDKAGYFRLLRPVANPTDQLVYTNFYILSRYSTPAGKMIDRDQPEKSLLLTYSLPHNHPLLPNKVEVPHHFADTTSPEYQGMVAWIKSLTFPPPNYGIIYEIPTPPPARPAHPIHPATTRPAK